MGRQVPRLILSALRRAALSAVAAGCLLYGYILVVNPDATTLAYTVVH
jgi:hypothetical protein